MPTPTYTLRLPRKVQDDLATFALIYGSANGRAFTREVLEVMTSGDMERIKAFNARLVHGMGEQLTLKLNASFDAFTGVEKPTAKPRKRVKPTPTKAPKRKPR